MDELSQQFEDLGGLFGTPGLQAMEAGSDSGLAPQFANVRWDGIALTRVAAAPLAVPLRAVDIRLQGPGDGPGKGSKGSPFTTFRVVEPAPKGQGKGPGAQGPGQGNWLGFRPATRPDPAQRRHDGQDGEVVRRTAPRPTEPVYFPRTRQQTAGYCLAVGGIRPEDGGLVTTSVACWAW